MTAAGLPAYIGPNQIVGSLGKGGMGVVLYGYAPGRRPVAVKVPRIEPDDSDTAKEELIKLFRREIKLVKKIKDNPFVVKLIDSGEHNGLPWASFEYIEGQDLAQLMRNNTSLPIAFTCAIGVAVCRILKALHEAGIIHRDLKPSNLMLTSQGDIKIIDFGIASSQEITAISQRHLDSGIGSAPYMAPEIWASKQPTYATDIFALGAILGEALSGHKMFPHPLGQIGQVIQFGQPSLDGVHPNFVNIITRCLAKNPVERPTLSDIEAELTQLSPHLGKASVRQNDTELAATVRQIVQEARDGKTLLYPPVAPTLPYTKPQAAAEHVIADPGFPRGRVVVPNPGQPLDPPDPQSPRPPRPTQEPIHGGLQRATDEPKDSIHTGQVKRFASRPVGSKPANPKASAGQDSEVVRREARAKLEQQLRARQAKKQHQRNWIAIIISILLLAATVAVTTFIISQEDDPDAVSTTGPDPAAALYKSVKQTFTPGPLGTSKYIDPEDPWHLTVKPYIKITKVVPQGFFLKVDLIEQWGVDRYDHTWPPYSCFRVQNGSRITPIAPSQETGKVLGKTADWHFSRSLVIPAFFDGTYTFRYNCSDQEKSYSPVTIGTIRGGYGGIGVLKSEYSEPKKLQLATVLKQQTSNGQTKLVVGAIMPRDISDPKLACIHGEKKIKPTHVHTYRLEKPLGEDWVWLGTMTFPAAAGSLEFKCSGLWSKPEYQPIPLG